jgi:hypothetical protein
VSSSQIRAFSYSRARAPFFMAEKTNLTPSSYNYSMSHPFDAIDMFIPGKISKWACFLNYFLLIDTSLLTFP